MGGSSSLVVLTSLNITVDTKGARPGGGENSEGRLFAEETVGAARSTGSIMLEVRCTVDLRSGWWTHRVDGESERERGELARASDPR